jgi:cytidylate kinase
MTAGTVTFSVQIGSGGYTIAHNVADKLGFRYYDWEVTSQAAEMAGVPPDVVAASERVPGFLERMMRRLSTAPTLSSEEAILEPAPTMVVSAVQSLTSDDYRQFVERVVTQLADNGDAVIVGHAGQAVLRDRPGIFKVLVLGSPKVRAERLALEQRVTIEQAFTTLKQSDKERSDLFRRVYHIDWLDAAVYDLCINTDHVPAEIAVETVVAAAGQMP